jgi:uncharacterized membrane protein
MQKHPIYLFFAILWSLGSSLAPALAQQQDRALTIYTDKPEEVLISNRTGLHDKSRRVEDRDARTGLAFRADPTDRPGEGDMWNEYTYIQGPGRIRGIFRLKVADNTSPQPVVTITGNMLNSDIQSRRDRFKQISLRGTDFTAPGKYQEFSLDILKGEKGFASWALSTHGVTVVSFDGIAIEQLSHLTTEDLLQFIDNPVKPADLALATDVFRVHETFGLFMPYWKVKEAMNVVAADLSGAERTQSHLNFHFQNTRLTGYPAKWEELYKHSVVVLNNVPSKAVSIVGTLMLEQYVRDGGCLILMGDTHGLVAGKWAQSVLGPLLPVTATDNKDLVYSPTPLPLQPASETFRDLNWAERPCTIYYHSADVQPESEVLVQAGRIPLIVQRKVGQGRIIVLLTSVFGGADPQFDGTPFWEWGDWPKLMARVIAQASP